MSDRPTPFDLVFGEIAEERFSAVREGLAAEGRDARERDEFVLSREAANLLRDLTPEAGGGEVVESAVAFVHAAFQYWLDGKALVRIDRTSLDRLLRDLPDPAHGPRARRAYYLQVPAQRVWAAVRPDDLPDSPSPPEPLDGCFVLPDSRGIAVVAVFGLRPDRDGFTVVHGAGPRAETLARQDHSALFSARLEGGTGAGAGLHSLVGMEELLELAYRVDGALGPNGANPGVQRLSLL